MKNNAIILAFCLTGILAAASCRKSDNDPAPAASAGKIKMEFLNKVGTEPLKMGDAWYKNEKGDSFTVSTFNYYISNIRLNAVSGSSFAESESYHLLKQSDPSSLVFDLNGVPAAQYRSVTFTIGIDSTRNVSGAQSGALDPANGMFWSWHSGYIMLKLEGTSPVVTASGKMFMLHAGGFSGVNNVLRTITLEFLAPVTVNNNEVHIHLEADVLEALRTPNTWDLSKNPVIMAAGPEAVKFADNYADMFRITAAGN